LPPTVVLLQSGQAADEGSPFLKQELHGAGAETAGGEGVIRAGRW
jgi:hypothetical protein